jgi:O-methyltransferase involved in polyketide biosynthesis
MIMAHRLTIEPQSVQETMLLPVWGRAEYSHLYPELLDDPRAEEIMGKIDYDFSKVEKGFDEYGGVSYLLRARNFDDAIKEYIKKYPEATIINLGAGLDTTFFRVDNGKFAWYDLDLPDAIDFRKKLIPETSRSECIAKSAFDISWFDDVGYKEEKGIYFIAGGLFH